MFRSKAAKAGAIGFLVFWVSIAGALIHDFVVSRVVWKPHITPDVYVLATLAVAGMLVSFTAAIVSVVGWTRRRVLLKSGAAGVQRWGWWPFGPVSPGGRPITPSRSSITRQASLWTTHSIPHLIISLWPG